MVSFDDNIRLSAIEKNVAEIKVSINRIAQILRPENDLWDNSDIIREWHVSERTLANWRSKRLIAFIKVNGKIWYPRVAREKFLEDHAIVSMCNKEGYEGN